VVADAIRRRRPDRDPKCNDEFNDGVVRLVLDEGKTVGAAALDMDLTEAAVREWFDWLSR
jgi:hypothetical protein